MPIVWDEDPTNQKEERKLNDTYLWGGGGNMRRKGKKEIKNDTSIGGNGKEKTEKRKGQDNNEFATLWICRPFRGPSDYRPLKWHYEVIAKPVS